jgi:hypothetical protein
VRSHGLLRGLYYYYYYLEVQFPSLPTPTHQQLCIDRCRQQTADSNRKHKLSRHSPADNGRPKTPHKSCLHYPLSALYQYLRMCITALSCPCHLATQPPFPCPTKPFLHCWPIILRKQVVRPATQSRTFIHTIFTTSSFTSFQLDLQGLQMRTEEGMKY